MRCGVVETCAARLSIPCGKERREKQTRYARLYLHFTFQTVSDIVADAFAEIHIARGAVGNEFGGRAFEGDAAIE